MLAGDTVRQVAWHGLEGWYWALSAVSDSDMGRMEKATIEEGQRQEVEQELSVKCYWEWHNHSTVMLETEDRRYIPLDSPLWPRFAVQSTHSTHRCGPETLVVGIGLLYWKLLLALKPSNSDPTLLSWQAFESPGPDLV